jgi:hypothetical protein
MSYITKIRRELLNLIKQGEEGSYLMIESGPYYIQITRSLNSSKIYIMACANSHIKPEARLKPDQENKIISIGLQIDPENKDYYIEFDPTPDLVDKIAKVVDQLLSIYGVGMNKLEIDLVLD